MGSTISSNFSLDREIGKRIGKAATTFVRLTTRVWENSKFSVKTKIAMYNACIISKLLYRSETWTTHAMQEKRLHEVLPLAVHLLHPGHIVDGQSVQHGIPVPRWSLVHVRQRRLH